MTAVLLAAEHPLLQEIFPQVPLTDQVRYLPLVILAALLYCLGAAYLALWRAAPDYRVFRSLGVFSIAVGIVESLEYLGATVPSLSVRAIAAAMLVESAGEAMRAPNRRWTLFVWPVCIFASIAAWFPSLKFVSDWPIYVAEVPLGFLIVKGFRQGNARDRMVAAAFSVYFFARLTVSTNFQRLTGIGNYVTFGSWRWPVAMSTIFSLLAATLVIFARDLIRDRREKERMAAELAAARAIQQVLIPDQTPTVPGFNIQSVYKPFGEVGGDFFQIIATSNGGALAVIGDVSGKGIPAAMTVSLLVGTVRTLAHYTQSPGEILAAMNQRMLARSHGGFTTCLVLRADPDGTLTIANAGHIAPYLDGQELPIENSFPLGISPDTIYAESTFRMSPKQQLTLLTDGVIEARDKAGALFGFERSASLSTQPAEAIAQAAQAFGQDDDITVLSLTRTVDLNPAMA